MVTAATHNGLWWKRPERATVTVRSIPACHGWGSCRGAPGIAIEGVSPGWAEKMGARPALALAHPGDRCVKHRNWRRFSPRIASKWSENRSKYNCLTLKTEAPIRREAFRVRWIASHSGLGRRGPPARLLGSQWRIRPDPALHASSTSFGSAAFASPPHTSP